MIYSEFLDSVEQLLQDILGERYVVERQSITQNNGVVLDGISILHQEESLAPVIYLRQYFEEYTNGMELSEIIKEIMKIYENSTLSLPGCIPKFETFEAAKGWIVYRLIRREGNELILADVPYTPYLDLAIVYYLLVDTGEMGQVTALIHNQHVNGWGVTKEVVHEWATRNTPKLLPALIQPIGDIIREYGLNKELAEEMKESEISSPFFVLSNPGGLYGAACMLYDGVLRNFAEEKGEDIIILPSSLHEVLLLPKSGWEEYEELQMMVREINRTLPEEIVLSDHIYIYRKETRQTLIAT